MITYYCPKCWKIVKQYQTVCPDCDFVLEEFSKLSYEEKLLSSLRHAVPERRIIAAQILGELKSREALREFKKIVDSNEPDYYFMRVVLKAVAGYGHPARLKILKKATGNPSVLVSALAEELMDSITGNPS
jgi:HEAT repeat protein